MFNTDHPVTQAASRCPKDHQKTASSTVVTCLAAGGSVGGKQENQYCCFLNSQTNFPVFISLWNFLICFIHLFFFGILPNWKRTSLGERKKNEKNLCLWCVRCWTLWHLQAVFDYKCDKRSMWYSLQLQPCSDKYNACWVLFIYSLFKKNNNRCVIQANSVPYQ